MNPTSGPAPAVSGVTELHVHLEGSLSVESAIELAKVRQHSWGMLSPEALRRSFRYASLDEFLLAIREMCRVIATPEGLERTAYELSAFLSAHGVEYAEVYASPYIYVRWGMDYGVALRAIDDGFSRGEAGGHARCSILLDSVRQWGPDAAHVVLDGLEANRVERVRGFGLGGEERVPLEDFREVYDRARGMGLRTVAHAGESTDAADVRKAIDVLGADRVAHGIRAVDDEGLLRELAARGTALDVCITSNYQTRSVSGRHPIRELVDAGVAVTLGTDDPSLFRTTLPREYTRARRFGGLTARELAAVARNGVTHSFADDATKRRLLEVLEERGVASPA
jgi:aminodeoxyfutalosine deaminase